jgi:glycosyltransferase involved in cell wall biosynthesis
MAEKRRVGIIYQYNEGWIGGVYYVQNLITALGKLPEEKQPEVFAICADKKAFDALQNTTNYRYLSYQPSLPSYSVIKRGINKISRLLFKQNAFDHLRNKVDCFFPLNGIEFNHGSTKNIYWIPDFQDEYFPHFFPKEELVAIQNWRRQLALKRGAFLVLSSEAALSDYIRFYPAAVTKNVVIPFAVNHDFGNLPDIEELRSKYQLPQIYFISPNQFWKHKNHQLILEAAKILKAKGINAHIAFTGKEYDHRNPEYVTELKQFIVNEGLEDYISFLGFIDRGDQLQLMRNACAVIQPSRFEGWSTVVEDAKSMDQLVLASAIPVHEEQLGDAGYYFNTDNAEELVALMEKVLFAAPEKPSFNYEKAQLRFAERFYQLLTKAVQQY